MESTVLATGLGWTEGPLITAGGDIVVTSMDHGAVFRLRDGAVVKRYVAGGVVNGAAEDAGGRLLLAQAGGGFPGTTVDGITGGVQVVDTDGRIHWVTQDPIAPNDLCFGPDGMLYVTDPTRNRPERDDGRIWRVDPVSGTARILASVPWYPNGIAFGPDGLLYVASTGDRKIVRFDASGERLSRAETFIQVTAGGPDGFAFDADGTLVVCCLGAEGASGHLEAWSADGVLVDTIRPGTNRFYTNVAIDDDARLIVTDTRDDGGVIALAGWRAPGLALHPFRAGAHSPAGGAQDHSIG